MIWLIIAYSLEYIKNNHYFTSTGIKKVIEKSIPIHKLIDRIKSAYTHYLKIYSGKIKRIRTYSF